MGRVRAERALYGGMGKGVLAAMDGALMMLFPKKGTLERVMLDAAMACKPGEGVSFLDFVGTGITEENIDQIARNLRTGMFEAENDNSIKFDS